MGDRMPLTSKGKCIWTPMCTLSVGANQIIAPLHEKLKCWVPGHVTSLTHLEPNQAAQTSENSHCVQLAVAVSSRGCKGVRVHGGSGLGRVPGATRCRPQPPRRAHVARQRCSPRAGARTWLSVMHQPFHVQACCVHAMGTHLCENCKCADMLQAIGLL